MTFDLCLCRSHLQLPSFLGTGTSMKDISLVQWTKGPDKAILGETTHRTTLQIFLLFLKRRVHAFFSWIVDNFDYLFLLYCHYFMTPYYILCFMTQSKCIEKEWF